jgi:hypothetical protein
MGVPLTIAVTLVVPPQVVVLAMCWVMPRDRVYPVTVGSVNVGVTVPLVGLLKAALLAQL